MITLFIFLQSGQGGNPMMTFLFMGLMLVVFYFFLIRPQTKRQKEQQNFMSTLQKGDQVVTASGLLGSVLNVEDNVVTLDLGNKVVVRVTKNSVSKEMTEGFYGKKSQNK